MHKRAFRGATDEIVQRDFDRSLGAVIAVHSAVHGGERAGNVGGITAEEVRR